MYRVREVTCKRLVVPVVGQSGVSGIRKSLRPPKLPTFSQSPTSVKRGMTCARCHAALAGSRLLDHQSWFQRHGVGDVVDIGRGRHHCRMDLGKLLLSAVTPEADSVAQALVTRRYIGILIIPLCSMSPKFLKLLKRGHENASRGSLANPPLASICA